MSLIIDLTQTLYDSQFSTALRESQYMFPIVEGIHLLGLAFSVGLIAITDLRLIGKFLTKAPAVDVLRQLRPWVLAGFIVTFLSGVLLYCAEGKRIVQSTAFLVKLGFVFLAGVNALLFELKLGRRAKEWGNLVQLPAGVKLAGWVSLIFWTAAVVAGRMIPYLG